MEQILTKLPAKKAVYLGVLEVSHEAKNYDVPMPQGSGNGLYGGGWAEREGEREPG